MSVQVNREGNVLKLPNGLKIRPLHFDANVKPDEIHDDLKFRRRTKTYNIAQEKCCFKGFEFAYNGYSVIRILVSYNHSIELSNYL